MNDPVRFSNLKLMGRSAAHYAHNLATPFHQTSAMLVGSAIDALFFGTQKVVCYEKARDARQAAWRDFRDEHANDIILARSEYIPAVRAVEALLASSDACRLLTGERQQRINWTMNGRACSGTPDVFSQTGFVTDLKKTRCGDPDKFRWDAKRLAYHAQLSFYRNGLLECGKLTGDPDCYIVTVETDQPNLVTCFELTKPTLELGERIWRLWFERLLVCEASESFPGYAQSVVPLELEDSFGTVSLVIDGEEIDV